MFVCFVNAPESCKTAKCGTHKRCVLRNGQAKCVCAPKCKVKNSRPKRVNHHSQLNDGNHQGVNRRRYNADDTSNLSSRMSGRGSDYSKINNINKNSSRTGKRHQHPQSYQSPHQRIHALDFVNNVDRRLNDDRTQFQSDKIISIITPSPSLSIRPSNLNSSHSHKKLIDAHAVAAAAAATQAPLLSSNRSSNLNAMEPLQSTTKRHSMATVHHSYSAKRRGTKNRSTNNSTSSLIDNNIVNVHSQHRISSGEQEFISKFHGHDIPYPPIDTTVGFQPNSLVLVSAMQSVKNNLYYSFILEFF